MCLSDFTEMETQSSQDFQDLCTFESFKSFWSYYGYGVDQQELIDREFKRIKGKINKIKNKVLINLLPHSLTFQLLHVTTVTV